MATSKQEKTYNEIIEYYNYADRLIEQAESSDHELRQEQFDVIEDIVENLEKCADKLTTKYIEYVKSDESEQVIDEIRSNLNQILAKIEECRNKILMTFNENN